MSRHVYVRAPEGALRHVLVRRPPMGRALRVCLALSGLLALVGCQKVIGLEERHLVDAGAAEPTDTPECQEYCDTVLANCTEEYAAYRNKETCLAVCRQLPQSEELEGNTVACRAAEAADAPAEPDFHCPFAAPGGAGRCGSNCENYCQLFADVCPENLVNPDCEIICSGLRNEETFDANKDFAEGTDNVQCRLAHLSAAAFADPATHCGHSQIVPADNSPCSLKDGAEPSCRDYCRLNLVACRDDLAVYESRAQCEAACEKMELGQVGDKTGNTVACRRYHSYASTLSPEDHCAHTSISGDGHCGKICPVYCEFLASACATEFGATFSSQADCESKCEPLLVKNGDLNADEKFSVTLGETLTGESPELHCRLLELTRALAGSAAACEAAVGGGRCDL